MAKNRDESSQELTVNVVISPDAGSELDTTRAEVAVRRHLAQTSSNAQQWVELAAALVTQSILEEREGQARDAIAVADEALAAVRQAVSLRKSPDMIANLTVALAHLGQLKLESDDLNGALEAFTEAVAANREYPESAVDLAMSLDGLAAARQASGEDDLAEQALEEALSIGRTQIEGKAEPHALRTLVAILDRCIDLKLDADDPEGAMQLVREAISTGRSLMQLDPSVESRRELDRFLDELARHELESRNIESAFELYAESLCLNRAIAAEDPSPESLMGLSISLNNVAQCEMLRQHVDRAVLLCSEVLDIRVALAAEECTEEVAERLRSAVGAIGSIFQDQRWATWSNGPAGRSLDGLGTQQSFLASWISALKALGETDATIAPFQDRLLEVQQRISACPGEA
jgi:tetratricopeptide (TPR) repeat protein